jgi:hypothetical protein
MAEHTTDIWPEVSIAPLYLLKPRADTCTAYPFPNDAVRLPLPAPIRLPLTISYAGRK